MIDTKKLKALMVEKGYTQEQLAQKLGIRVQTMNYKINNKREFKVSEIIALKKILDIQDVDAIFLVNRT